MSLHSHIFTLLYSMISNLKRLKKNIIGCIYVPPPFFYGRGISLYSYTLTLRLKIYIRLFTHSSPPPLFFFFFFFFKGKSIYYLCSHFHIFTLYRFNKCNWLHFPPPRPFSKRGSRILPRFALYSLIPNRVIRLEEQT